MSLKSAFKKAARTAIKAFGDVSIICTYTVYGATTYDELTDTTTTQKTDYPEIKVIITPFSERESQKAGNEDDVLPTDVKGMIASLDLGFKPLMNHELTVTSSSDKTIRSGDVFVVKGFTTDPAEAIFTIHLRTK